jgi:hypothetical protein
MFIKIIAAIVIVATSTSVGSSGVTVRFWPQMSDFGDSFLFNLLKQIICNICLK